MTRETSSVVSALSKIVAGQYLEHDGTFCVHTQHLPNLQPDTNLILCFAAIATQCEQLLRARHLRQLRRVSSAIRYVTSFVTTTSRSFGPHGDRRNISKPLLSLQLNYHNTVRFVMPAQPYNGMRVSAHLQLLTMETELEGPMIDIIKVSEWLTKNVNERLYPRLL